MDKVKFMFIESDHHSYNHLSLTLPSSNKIKQYGTHENLSEKDLQIIKHFINKCNRKKRFTVSFQRSPARHSVVLIPSVDESSSTTQSLFPVMEYFSSSASKTTSSRRSTISSPFLSGFSRLLNSKSK